MHRIRKYQKAEECRAILKRKKSYSMNWKTKNRVRWVSSEAAVTSSQYSVFNPRLLFLSRGGSVTAVAGKNKESGKLLLRLLNNYIGPIIDVVLGFWVLLSDPILVFLQISSSFSPLFSFSDCQGNSNIFSHWGYGYVQLLDYIQSTM